MLLEDQYGVGDVIDVGPATGTVEAVTLRVTKIRDADGTLWYIPNGSMLRVGNKTQGWATAVVEVDVDYFADLDDVRALLDEAAAPVAADPVLGPELQGEPTITGIEKLSADAVTLRLKVRTSPAKQWEVARALRVAHAQRARGRPACRSPVSTTHSWPIARPAAAATAEHADADDGGDGRAGADERSRQTGTTRPATETGTQADASRDAAPQDPRDTPVDDALRPPRQDPPKA